MNILYFTIIRAKSIQKAIAHIVKIRFRLKSPITIQRVSALFAIKK